MELQNAPEIPRQLEIASPTPICDLSPEIPDPASRAVRGIVTITWPYNSVKNTFAFILAEPDFRLRRNRGQVRINFTGPAAKALGECGLGGSDEIYLSLDGAEWESEEVKKRQSLPGTGIEWQLKFSNKLLLQAKLGDVHETKVVSIDGSASTEPIQPIDEPVETPHLRDPPSPPTPTEFTAFTPAKDPRVTKLHDEYNSPAFIKRARISYGSLFEDGFDIFDDDGGVKGKGRKRTRFGRNSGAWRYSSQSASPEPPATSRSEEDISDEQVEQSEQMEQEDHISSPPKPGMADEGCQTMELDFATPVPAQVSPNIALLEHQELPPGAETMHHPHENHVDQGLQTFPQKGFSSSSLGAFHPPGSTHASQHAPAHVTPFPLHHEDDMINNFQPHLETQHIDSTSHIYDVDPAIYEQAPSGLFLAPEDGSVDHHHPHSMEELGQTNLSYPPTDRANFVRDIEHGAPDDGQQGSPYPDAPQTYPHLGIADGEESRLSAPNFLTNYPPSFLEESQHFPQHSVEAPRFFGGEVEHPRVPAAVKGGSTSWTAVNSASEATSLPQTHRFDDADEGSPELPVVIDEGESDDESAPAPTAVEDTVSNGHRDNLEIYEDAEAEDEADAQYSDEDEPEYDGDEMGGDYDTRNYVGPDDDEDDSHDEDLRPRDLEPQFSNAEDWAEEDDLEEGEEEERRYETDSENDYDLDEEDEGEEEEDEEEEEGEMERPAPQVSQAAPIMIDLISSSEDEGEDEEDKEDDNENENEQEKADEDGEGDEDGYLDGDVDEDVDEDMDEDVDEDMDADEGVQLPQSRPARDAFIRTDTLASRTRQISDDEIESQEGDMSEPLSVTSDAQEEAVNMVEEVEEVEEEEAESVEGASSGDGEQRERALPREENDAFNITTETGNDDESQNDVKPITVDENMLPMSHEMAPAENSQEVVDIAGQDQPEALGTAPFTAAEGLEILSRTVDREKDEAEAEASDTNGISQVESEETSPILENPDEASQERDVDMAEGQVVKDDELPTQNDIQNPETRDIEMTEPRVIVDGGDSPTVHEDLEPVDLIRSSPERPLEDQSIGKSETLQKQTLAPSSPPLTQSFSSHPIEIKTEQLTNEPTTSSESQPPVEQLLTPLNTQLTVTNKSQEEPVVPSPVDVEEAHDTTQTAEFEEPLVNQAMTISEDVVEQDQVYATEVSTQAEDHGSDQIETQPQDLVSREDIEQLSQASPSKSVPSITFRTQVNLDDIIQANLRGESPQVQIDHDTTINTLDADSSHVSSSFRSQMEGDEELQASILEDNSYLFSDGRQGALEAGVASSQISDSGSQYLDADKDAPETGTLDNIGGPPSPVLGSDNVTKPEEIQSRSADMSHTKKNKQLPIESDEDSMNEESSQLDLSVQLARAANATRRRAKGPQTTTDVDPPHRKSEDSQSIRSLEEDSSVQLARASMNSSFNSSFKTDEESNSLVEAKLQLARHLRDELPDCTQLQVLRHHTGQSLDVMAVAMMQPPDPQRAKRGPREYMMSFTIADQSTAPNAVVEVQLYRPHKDALPVVRPGDVVLLRKFRVVSLQGKGFGLRTEDGSSWAVWETAAAVAAHNNGDDNNEDASSGSQQQPQVRGPPVEAIEKEARHAAYLREWFALLDEQARAKLERANQKIVNAKKSSRKT